MKNKKRLLIILLILIIIVLVVLLTVIVIGGIKNKEINDFQNEVAEAACNYASSEYNNPSLLEAYPHLTKVNYSTLINSGFLSEDLIDPKTHEKVSENTTDYIEITYADNSYICTFKEG